MGRRKKDTWDIGQVDSLRQAMFDQAREEFGAGAVYTGTEAEQRIVGLPIPALCLRYLFQSAVFPLGRFIDIVGKQGSGKSAMLYELFRWHYYYGGYSFLVETESKDSPDLRNAIVGDSDAVASIMADSLEGWMGTLLKCIRIAQGAFDGTPANPGPGRIRPVCFGIDSLTAVAAEETRANINKNGAPSRRYPIEAMKITDMFRVLPAEIRDFPFTLAGINHLKDAQSEDPRAAKRLPGGLGLRFQATYELEMAFVGDIRLKSYQGIEVTLCLRKNSMGPSRRKIGASLIWWDEPDEAGVMRQRVLWNCNAATIELLLAFHKDKWMQDAIQNIVDLHVVNMKGKKVWSNCLGISRDDPVSFYEAGEKIEARDDVCAELHKLFGIRNRATFKPGMDYRVQLDEAQKQLVPALDSNGEIIEATAGVPWSHAASLRDEFDAGGEV